MTNYTKTTNFATKDTLPSGNANKIVKGTEIDTEFNNIATAVATKADTAGPTLTGTTTFETLSDGTISITAFVDEDNMASDSATLLPTQQSVKAYVDSQVTAQDLDFQADSGGALSIDLDSETLTFTGGTGVDTSGSGNAVTFAIDSTVATLTGTQTLTNKTLTSPTLNTPTIGTSFTIGSATITEAELEILDGATVTTAELNVLDGITSTTAELNILDGVTSTAAELNILDGVTSTAAELNILDGVTSTAAELNILDGVTATTAELNIMDGVTATTAELNYVDGVTSAIQTQIDTKAPLASPTFTGTVTADGLTVDTTTLVVDATNNRVGIGTSSPARTLSLEGTDGRLVRLSHSSNPKIEFVDTTDGTSGAYLGSEDNELVFETNGQNERLRIDSSGNVGIGAAPTGVTGLGVNKFLEMGGATVPSIVFRPSGTTVENSVASAGDGLLLAATGAATASNNVIRFFTTNTNSSNIPTERMRILSTGGITFNGDTAQANALDDYEEGTWIPVLSGSGYSFGTHTGTYVKVGKVVTVSALFNITAVGSNTSNISISGYPFTADIATNQFQLGVVRQTSTTGVLYLCQINVASTIGGLNSMDGVTSGSNEIFTTGNYGLSMTYIASS